MVEGEPSRVIRFVSEDRVLGTKELSSGFVVQDCFNTQTKVFSRKGFEPKDGRHGVVKVLTTPPDLKEISDFVSDMEKSLGRLGDELYLEAQGTVDVAKNCLDAMLKAETRVTQLSSARRDAHR